MVERADWFSRRFVFDLSVWMFPNIVERLRGTPARVQERAGSLPGDLLIRRDGDRWSIQENAGHILDLEELWLGRFEDFFAGKERLRPADLTNKKTYVANHNAISIEAIIAAFRSVRLEMVQQLEACEEATILRTALHPRLEAEMRVLDLAFFIAEHDDHHLAEMTALMREFGKS